LITIGADNANTAAAESYGALITQAATRAVRTTIGRTVIAGENGINNCFAVTIDDIPGKKDMLNRVVHKSVIITFGPKESDR